MDTVSRDGWDGRQQRCEEGTVHLGRITISAQAAARLVEVLQLCETFLATPLVRAELADFCLSRPGVSSGWLIDMLGWHTLHLRARIDAGEERSP